jgi:hypothetical protein
MNGSGRAIKVEQGIGIGAAGFGGQGAREAMRLLGARQENRAPQLTEEDEAVRRSVAT